MEPAIGLFVPSAGSWISRAVAVGLRGTQVFTVSHMADQHEVSTGRQGANSVKATGSNFGGVWWVEK